MARIENTFGRAAEVRPQFTDKYAEVRQGRAAVPPSAINLFASKAAASAPQQKPEQKKAQNKGVPVDVASHAPANDLNIWQDFSLANTSRSAMMLVLSKIEVRLETAIGAETNKVVRAELMLGMKVVTENLRRHALVQAGSDALVGH